VETSISLSATLISDDPFINKMHQMMYPINERYNAGELIRYIDAFAISYNLSYPEGIRTEEFGSTTYSHLAFEKSIMRNKSFMQNYIDLIDYVIDTSYMQVKREKKKLLVFSATIEMCTELTKYFKNKYSQFDVRRYCEDDPYENLIDSDIRFSTILSAGTAHDIPDLTTTIMTTAISSIQSNVQALGRLRAMKDGHPVQFYYFVCSDIPKHIEYHQQKEVLLGKRAKSLKTINSGRYI
jgi:superfamily II DNA or RNA helicase